MNRPDEERELAPELIRSGQLLSAGKLKDAASARDAVTNGRG
jgi:hypothetical protein